MLRKIHDPSSLIVGVPKQREGFKLEMPLVDKVEHHQIIDLAEFSEDKFVRKALLQSKGIVCDFVCFEPGQSADFHKHPIQAKFSTLLTERAQLLSR